MLNKQGPGKIETCDYTWNPISGCLHGCDYCYMLRMEKRFPGIMKPKFKFEYLERIRRARKLKSGDKIFVGSSGDMWGEWVNREWLDITLNCIRVLPYVFQFLTKNPAGYDGWALPRNGWYGTTIDGTERTCWNRKLLLLNVHRSRIKFISFEPLLSPIVPGLLSNDIDWIIIGADSNKGAKKPPHFWATSLIEEARDLNIPVWVKDNYGYEERIKEFPS